MHTATLTTEAHNDLTGPRYERCVRLSKRVRWEIDRDVIRGRDFDVGRTFLPCGLSKVDELSFLDPADSRMLSQVQGRSYVCLLALFERFIGAKVLQVSMRHSLGDQTALEALLRFSDEELKHQELFRRLNAMLDAAMPAGHKLAVEPNDVARFVIGKGTWAVLAFILQIELVVQAHYERSIKPQAERLCPLWKDMFRYHWMEERQHAVLDELEWRAEDAKIDAAERDAAVDDLIELVGAMDGVLRAQAAADARYFRTIVTRAFSPIERQQIEALVLRAYRWQHILSGVLHPRFTELLGAMTTPAQMLRFVTALTPILAASPTDVSELRSPRPQ
jgi:hypothetical protein